VSDSSQIVVDVEVGPREAERLGGAVLAWLIGEGVVLPRASDSAAGGEGHRPGPGWRTATAGSPAFRRLRTNGVEILVGRRVFDGGGNGIELRCGACRRRFEPALDAWSEAVGRWAEGDDGASFACPGCGKSRPLQGWRGPTPWGFGNLAVQFWNWPALSTGFVRALGKQLGHETVVVVSRV